MATACDGGKKFQIVAKSQEKRKQEKLKEEKKNREIASHLKRNSVDGLEAPYESPRCTGQQRIWDLIPYKDRNAYVFNNFKATTNTYLLRKKNRKTKNEQTE